MQKIEFEKEVGNLFSAKRRFVTAMADIGRSTEFLLVAGSIAASGAVLSSGDDDEKKRAMKKLGVNQNDLNVSYYLEYASTGVIRSYFTGLNSPGYHNGTINIPLNTWAHVVVVRNQSDSTIQHYVNGNLDNTISGITGNINNGAFNLQMGRYSGGGYAFIGNIPSGKIYNRALTADEVLQNYNATK